MRTDQMIILMAIAESGFAVELNKEKEKSGVKNTNTLLASNTKWNLFVSSQRKRKPGKARQVRRKTKEKWGR